MIQVEDFKAPRFPKKELTNWVKENDQWNHDQWNLLLENLKEEGFGLYTDSEIGQKMIGNFIESKKIKIQ